MAPAYELDRASDPSAGDPRRGQIHTRSEEKYPRSTTGNESPNLKNDPSDALVRLDRPLVFGEITLSDYRGRHAEIAARFEEQGGPVASAETD